MDSSLTPCFHDEHQHSNSETGRRRRRRVGGKHAALPRQPRECTGANIRVLQRRNRPCLQWTRRSSGIARVDVPRQQANQEATPCFELDAIAITPVISSPTQLVRCFNGSYRTKARELIGTAPWPPFSHRRLDGSSTYKFVRKNCNEHQIDKGSSMVKSAAELIASPGNAERLLDEWVDTETRLCKSCTETHG